MTLAPDSPAGRPRGRLVAAAALVAMMLSGLVLLARPLGAMHGLGLLLGAVAVVAAIQATRTGDRRYWAGVLVALTLQVAVFLGSVAGTPPLARFRLVQGAAIVGYGAILVSALLDRLGRFTPGRTEWIVLAGTVGILGADLILGFGAPPNRLPPREDWPDSADAHPRLGRVPRAYSAFKTYYPDDRQGYLLGEDLRANTWELRVMPGSIAELVLPREDPELLRVAIRKAHPDTTWHVSLTQTRFEVEARVPYYISFRARADRPRPALVGFARNHPPWTMLGLYSEIRLTPAWKEFREVFVPRIADSNAAIVFHLAGSDIPLELAGVTLHGPPAGRKIDPIVPERFFIAHRRNALGCRDQDYAAPRPRGVRILALGDGFTSGEGVYEKDTFATLLERELNGPAPATPRGPGYEVINCGVSGYGTREQRLFYESFGATYQPTLVLVTMGWNDDRFYWEQRQRELFERAPGRLEELSLVGRKVEASLRLRRRYDYRGSVVDLRALDEAVQRKGGRLIVAVSRHGPAGLGEALLETVKKGLEGSGVPLLDLGTLETADSLRGDPRKLPGPQAHEAAAAALLRWLRTDILPGPGVTAKVP